MGYPSAIKGYKFLDLYSERIFMSRDVTFHKSIFPFQSFPSSTSPSNPLSQNCIPVVPPLPISDSIQHSKSVPFMDSQHPHSDHVSVPDSQIFVDHFSDLLEEVFVYLPNDVVDDPILHPEPLSPSSVPIPSFVPLLKRSTRVSILPPYL